MPTTIDDRLVAYLRDAHAIEQQALAQLRRAPEHAGEPQLAAVLREHLGETERHEQLMRARLEAHDARPSRTLDAAMAAGGVGFVLFARSQPDTPGKLAAHAYAYEHLELAAYELLACVAERAGDAETARVARAVREEERATGERIAACFDATVPASLAAAGEPDAGRALDRYLADAHALERQAIGLLEKAIDIGGDARLRARYREHLEETHGHREALERELARRDASPSALKDAALRAGATNWGLFFQAQPDTPGKLAAFAYAFEHLEIAGYEQLARVAEIAGDARAQTLALRIRGEEQGAAAAIARAFDAAARASLDAVGASR